ncbi:MAG: type III pantothenate kinase [Limnochordales bacterium]|nr:type III pantothenate kinase [Limnochordales bacterium]
MASTDKYLLTFDIGNSQTVIAAYPYPTDGVAAGADRESSLPPPSAPLASWRLATSYTRTVDELIVLLHSLLTLRQISPAQVLGVAIASVVPPVLPAFVEACRKLFPAASAPLVAKAEQAQKAGVKIDYPSPGEIGADRLLNCVAVLHRFRVPAIVVDFGTATTFDVISTDGAFVGGAIAPGVVTNLEALAQKTARLPKVELAAPPDVIGKSTSQAIQSGLIFGAAAQVEGMVARITRALGLTTRPLVIATGGLAALIAPHTSAIDRIEPFLTLDGLRLLYVFNGHGAGTPARGELA